MTASPSPADRAATLLATIDPLAAAATPGPWVVAEAVDEHWGSHSYAVNYQRSDRGPLGTYGFTEENAALIVALVNEWPAVRTLITDLLATADEAWGLVDELTKALARANAMMGGVDEGAQR